MDNNINNYCACTGTEGAYHIKLNQQGPQGPMGLQGNPGVDGYSPQVTVDTDTDTEYKLRITTAFTSFVTPNLLANASEAAVELVNNLRQEIANDYVNLTGEQTLTGKKTFNTHRNLIVQKDDRVNNTGRLYQIQPVVVDGDDITLSYLTSVYQNGIELDTFSSLVKLAKATDIPDISNLVTNTQLATTLGNYTTTQSLELLLNAKVNTDTYYTDKLEIQSEVASKLPIETYNQDKQTYALKSELPVTATLDTLGLVKPDGVTITIENGVLKGASTYELPIAGATTLGGIKIGEGLAIDGDGVVSVTGGGGGGTPTDGKYGIRGDYATHYGILDCPNGLIDYNATGKQITVNAGIVMQLPGNTVKTTIASAITKTLESNANITLFYAAGEILEVGKVDYSTTEPEDNGVGNYQAWYNPQVGKWKLKSNDTGNVWRETVATPIANVYLNDANITRIDYIGYRILDDDIIPQQSDIENLQDTIDVMQQTINQLETRLAALEANINGGNA